MDEVFDSGLPPWRSHKIRSARLEQLAEELARDPKMAEAEGEHITVPAPAGTEATAAADVEKQV
jgi:hypothetical protein